MSGHCKGEVWHGMRRRRCERRIKEGVNYCWQHRLTGNYITVAEAERIVFDMMSPPEAAPAEPQPRGGRQHET